MRYFFYGTLMDSDVRAWILGERIGRKVLAAAILPGHRRVYLRDRSYPVVVPARGHAVEGLLAEGLDRRAVARLAAFESDEYIAANRAIRLLDGVTVLARVFVASRLAYLSEREWDVGTWQRLYKRKFARRHKAPFGGPGGRMA